MREEISLGRYLSLNRYRPDFMTFAHLLRTASIRIFRRILKNAEKKSYEDEWMRRFFSRIRWDFLRISELFCKKDDSHAASTVMR